MSSRKTVTVVFGAALILVGVFYLGSGLAMALAAVLGLAGGAAVAGLLLLLPPLLWAAAAGRLASAEPQRPARGETLWIDELTRLAPRKPLLAVLLAVAAGAVGSLLRRN